LRCDRHNIAILLPDRGASFRGPKPACGPSHLRRIALNIAKLPELLRKSTEPVRIARPEILERFYSLATELVALKVDVLVAINRLDALAAQRLHQPFRSFLSTFLILSGSKLVVSIAHPGDNITGLSNFAGRIAVCDLFAAACRETRSCRENYHLYVPTDQPRRSLVIDKRNPGNRDPRHSLELQHEAQRHHNVIDVTVVGFRRELLGDVWPRCAAPRLTPRLAQLRICVQGSRRGVQGHTIHYARSTVCPAGAFGGRLPAFIGQYDRTHSRTEQGGG
jgi:hypothetical protein